MPTAEWNFSTSVVNGKIYSIGHSVVQEYDPATNNWTKKADMPTARGYPSTCAVGRRIYVIGGTDLEGMQFPLDKGIVEEYDTGFVPEGVEPEGKLPTTWGEVKSQ